LQCEKICIWCHQVFLGNPVELDLALDVFVKTWDSHMTGDLVERNNILRRGQVQAFSAFKVS